MFFLVIHLQFGQMVYNQRATHDICTSNVRDEAKESPGFLDVVPKVRKKQKDYCGRTTERSDR